MLFAFGDWGDKLVIIRSSWISIDSSCRLSSQYLVGGFQMTASHGGPEGHFRVRSTSAWEESWFLARMQLK